MWVVTYQSMELTLVKALAFLGRNLLNMDRGRFYWAILIVARKDVPIALSWNSILIEKRVRSGHAVEMLDIGVRF